MYFLSFVFDTHTNRNNYHVHVLLLLLCVFSSVEADFSVFAIYLFLSNKLAPLRLEDISQALLNIFNQRSRFRKMI